MTRAIERLTGRAPQPVDPYAVRPFGQSHAEAKAAAIAAGGGGGSGGGGEVGGGGAVRTELRQRGYLA